jgi:hypothetical protein
MAVGDFDTYYSDNPWEVVDKNQRTWYDPELITLFRQRSLFTPTIQFTKNLESVKATKMVMTQLPEPHPDYTALALRQIWMPASHVDSRNVEIVFQRQGGKVAYHKYDDMITYWQQNGNAGLRRIMRGALGGHMVDVLDLLSRNAYLSGSLTSGYAIYEGGGTDFSAIGTSDIFSLGQALDIWLGMSLRGVASALGVAGAANNIICYTSPSVIYDIQKGTGSDEWIAVNQYEGRVQALRNEVGTYKNVRFVQSPRLVLWNAGEVIAQTTITAAVTAGDGAPDPSSTKVDGTYLVGQETGGITNSIPYNDTFITGTESLLAENDMITLHLTRTSAYGITDGVDFAEGTAQVRRITSIDTTANTITLDKPVMLDYDTDLGAGVYGYITKGRNIHGSIFVGGPQGIVSGIAQPPRVHTPPPVDDFLSIFRFSWDGYFGFQPYAPEVFEVVFSAGTTRVKGAPAVV